MSGEATDHTWGRRFDPPPEGHGGELARAAIACEVARSGISEELVRQCWRHGISVDHAIEIANKQRQQQQGPS